MGKYDKFGTYLENLKGSSIRLSFAEIEEIIGAQLPPSRQYPAWWSNNPFNSVMTKAWLKAGFKSSDVDVEGEKVSFVRSPTPTPNTPTLIPEAAVTEHVPQSPLFGCMKGTSFVAAGVDLTEPADPDWAKVYDDDYIPPGADLVVSDVTLSVADKIRELNGMGIARAEIGRLLGKRYQHVRNVLERDHRKEG